MQLLFKNIWSKKATGEKEVKIIEKDTWASWTEIFHETKTRHTSQQDEFFLYALQIYLEHQVGMWLQDCKGRLLNLRLYMYSRCAQIQFPHMRKPNLCTVRLDSSAVLWCNWIHPHVDDSTLFFCGFRLVSTTFYLPKWNATSILEIVKIFQSISSNVLRARLRKHLIKRYVMLTEHKWDITPLDLECEV